MASLWARQELFPVEHWERTCEDRKEEERDMSYEGMRDLIT